MTKHIFSVFSVFSRSNDECNKKQPSDCDTLEYRNGEGKKTVVFDEQITFFFFNGSLISKFTKLYKYLYLSAVTSRQCTILTPKSKKPNIFRT